VNKARKNNPKAIHPNFLAIRLNWEGDFCSSDATVGVDSPDGAMLGALPALSIEVIVSSMG
jgi:hypothetical protein